AGIPAAAGTRGFVVLAKKSANTYPIEAQGFNLKPLESNPSLYFIQNFIEARSLFVSDSCFHKN
ncbi:MAG: hypothetical protein CEN92_192, partial [Candidatus Berkelbacteria bacterium Licking1014_96]